MSNKSDFPAFPTQSNGGDIYGGVTVREHFAAMAMQGLCSNMDRVVATAEHDGRPEDVDEYLAVLSVAFADALLRELEK